MPQAQWPLLPRENPRDHVSIEWWFVQGRCAGAGGPPRDFMSVFFRLNPDEKAFGDEDGHALIVTVTTPEAARHSCRTIIDRTLLRHLSHNKIIGEETNLDRHYLDAYLEEISTYGPAEPIRLVDGSAEFSADPLRFDWDDFHFSQTDRTFELSFRDPETGEPFDLSLTPTYPRLDITDRYVENLEPVEYLTYPRMALKGEIAGRAVAGQAWFDHQAGSPGWFLGQPHERDMLGWVWLGINLDDGTDIVVVRHKKMKSGKIISTWAAIKEPEAEEAVRFEAHLEPVRRWRSKRTRAEYPIQWRLRVPGKRLHLDVEPLLDDQEIFFPGPPRSIWQGAGAASGAVEGRKVTGRARIELTGYGYIFDHKDYLSSISRRIDDHLGRFLPQVIDDRWLEKYIGPAHFRHESRGLTKVLAEPAWDMIKRGGKRWRPISGLLLLETLGVDSEPFEQLCAAITELNHTGSLIIDDIEDDSVKRRGEECVHLRYGVDVAINAGCSLYFLPHLLVRDHPRLDPDQKLELYQTMVRAFAAAHLGQGLDIYWSKYLTKARLKKWLGDGLEEKLLQMYAYKTAGPTEATAEIACVIARAGEDLRRRYASLGRALGVAFQIVDDVNNFSRSPRWTKVSGEDIAAGKPTYVIIRAIRMLPPGQRERFLDILGSPEMRRDPRMVEEAVDLVAASGSLDWCRDTANSMVEEEWRRFSAAVPQTDAKIMLRMLISSLINLAYEI